MARVAVDKQLLETKAECLASIYGSHDFFHNYLFWSFLPVLAWKTIEKKHENPLNMMLNIWLLSTNHKILLVVNRNSTPKALAHFHNRNNAIISESLNEFLNHSSDNQCSITLVESS